MTTHPDHFVFSAETGFLHVGQAGLELLTSDDLRTLATQSAGITGVSHRAQLKGMMLNRVFIWKVTFEQILEGSAVVNLGYLGESVPRKEMASARYSGRKKAHAGESDDQQRSECD